MQQPQPEGPPISHFETFFNYMHNFKRMAGRADRLLARLCLSRPDAVARFDSGSLPSRLLAGGAAQAELAGSSIPSLALPRRQDWQETG